MNVRGWCSAVQSTILLYSFHTVQSICSPSIFDEIKLVDTHTVHSRHVIYMQVPTSLLSKLCRNSIFFRPDSKRRMNPFNVSITDTAAKFHKYSTWMYQVTLIIWK